MAAPTTAVLTSFTGADEDPLSESGAWAGPTRNGLAQCERRSNQGAHSANPSAQSASSYRSASQVGPDSEVFMTVGTLPGAGEGVAVWARIHNPGNATTMEAYIGAWTEGTGWRLFKCTGGSTFTQIGSTTASPALAAGDKMFLEVVGTSLTLWHFTGGSWVSRVTGTDSAITGQGYIGMEFAADATEALVDDFGGGTVVVAGNARDMLLVGVA